jgi:hypothetical protein
VSKEGNFTKDYEENSCNIKKLMEKILNDLRTYSGENMVKGAKGAKSRSPFPRIAHDTCHLCVGL